MAHAGAQPDRQARHLEAPRKLGLATLRGYLLIAFALVVVKIVEVAVR